MYAIVEIAGKQFRVQEKRRVRVPLLNVESGKKVEFGNVVVYNDDKKLQIGTPLVDKVKVSATVIEHNREKKIIVFKKKRRKGYQVKNGHRQHYSLILVDKIGAGTVSAEPKAAVKSEPKAKTAEKTAAKEKAAPAKQAAKVESKPKATAAKTAKTAAKTKPASAKSTAKPKAETKAKTAAKPKAEAKAKTSAKPKAAAKPKTPAKKAQPKDKKE